MQIDQNTVILVLIGLVQAWFFFDKNRDATEREEMRESIKSMVQTLSQLQQDLAVVRFALFKEQAKQDQKP
jgi:hypothetical protein